MRLLKCDTSKDGRNKSSKWRGTSLDYRQPSFFSLPVRFNWPKLVGLGLCLWLVVGFGACTIQGYLAQPVYIELSQHTLEVLK